MGFPRRRPSRSADVDLVVASGLTGVAAAGFLLISARAVGPASFAPLAQLWTIWSISAASLLFAYQQWAIAVGIGGRPAAGRVRARGRRQQQLRGPLLLAVGVTVVAWSLAVAARSSLFHDDGVFWPSAAATVVAATAIVGVVRGRLAVAHRHRTLAAAIVVDNLVRLLAASILASLGAGVTWYGVAMVASFAPVVGLGMLRADAADSGSARRPDQRIDARDRRAESAQGDVPSPSPLPPTARTPRRATATVSSAALAGFLSHVALAGPPLLLALNGAPADTVSVLFVVLTAVRLPHLLLQAGAPRAGVVFQRWSDAGQHERLMQARLVTGAATLCLALLAGVVGAVAGDPLVGRLFDIAGRVDALTYGLLSAASVLSVGATFATVLLVAEGRSGSLASRWGGAVVVAAVAGRAVGITDVRPIALGLVLLHLIVLVALLATSRPVAGALSDERPARAPIRQRRANVAPRATAPWRPPRSRCGPDVAAERSPRATGATPPR